MRKKYIRPSAELVHMENIMEGNNPHSVGAKGSVTGENDTNWGFGGDGEQTDTPDAKWGTWDVSLWDDGDE